MINSVRIIRWKNTIIMNERDDWQNEEVMSNFCIDKYIKVVIVMGKWL